VLLVGNCELHPLIHTLLDFNVAQDVEKKKAEPKLRHWALKGMGRMEG